nr:hypothetical protein [Tanacetum cinerariifolium]
MPSKDNLYNGQKGVSFENPSYFEKAKDLRPTLYDEKVIGLGYTPMFLTHSDEALEIEKFKRSRENKIDVRRPKNSGVIWKKKGSSNTSNVGLSAVSVPNLNKNVKRYSRKDLLACNNSHLGETRVQTHGSGISILLAVETPSTGSLRKKYCLSPKNDMPPRDKARLEEACMITINETISDVLLNEHPSKEKDPGSFTIPCNIGQLHINNTIVDVGASISLMAYMMYEKLGLGEPKATRMSLELADRLRYLGYAQRLRSSYNYKKTIFGNLSSNDRRIQQKDNAKDETIDAKAQELLANDESDSFLLRGLEKSIDQLDLESDASFENKADDDSGPEEPIRRIDFIITLYPITQTKSDNVEMEHLYSASANEIDEKKPKLEDLPHHLEYAYLHGDKSFRLIISSKLLEKEKISLLQVLEKRKGAIA